MKFACSSFSWSTKDNKHLLGRTYDQFGNLQGNKIVIIPRNYTLNLECSNINNTYKTKYSYVGMGILGLNTPILTDGINEMGLMGALLHYPKFAHYNTQTSKDAININPGFLVTYILGECANLNELLFKIKNINLTDELVFDEKIPVHYIFSDRSGETIVIEPDKNGISIHRNSIGVLANSPNYFWQKQNLRNYLGMSNEPRLPQKIVDFKIAEFGKGSGMLGLPGDYTSVSRFVRLSFFKEFAVKGQNELEGITKMFQNFSTVYIPDGIIKEKDTPLYEKTLCTACMCSESLTYYFTLLSNNRINAITLEHEKDNTDIKYIDLPNTQDISFLN